MKKVGIIGYRGMVGSVLMERLLQEDDLSRSDVTFFSTSQHGQAAPHGFAGSIQDANHIPSLLEMDIILTTQGGDYTQAIHPQLRAQGWQGYWIDAASTLRMNDNAVIVLDPLNRHVIDKALADGKKDFIGGNCTVSLMMLAIGGLIERDWIEWISTMTYQAASGAGAANMRELLIQMGELNSAVKEDLVNPASNILSIDRTISDTLRQDVTIQQFGAPLAGNVLPWIDSAMPDGKTREEWKSQAEANKILDRSAPLAIDGLCVRVGAMRSHAQALTIKLKKHIPLAEIEQTIQAHNAWVQLVENTKEASLAHLTPAAVSGTHTIAIGRLRYMSLGDTYLCAFTVGDQLLWGAAEPLRRIFAILNGNL